MRRKLTALGGGTCLRVCETPAHVRTNLDQGVVRFDAWSQFCGALHPAANVRQDRPASPGRFTERLDDVHALLSGSSPQWLPLRPRLRMDRAPQACDPSFIPDTRSLRVPAASRGTVDTRRRRLIAERLAACDTHCECRSSLPRAHEQRAFTPSLDGSFRIGRRGRSILSLRG